MNENKEKQRTLKQNRALHKWFTELAEALNSSGLDMRKTLRADIEIPWTMEAVKTHLWKPVMAVQLAKKSTTEMTTTDIDKVFDTITKHLGEKYGLYIPFPSFETMLEIQEEKYDQIRN